MLSILIWVKILLVGGCFKKEAALLATVRISGGKEPI